MRSRFSLQHSLDAKATYLEPPTERNLLGNEQKEKSARTDTKGIVALKQRTGTLQEQTGRLQEQTGRLREQATETKEENQTRAAARAPQAQKHQFLETLISSLLTAPGSST